MEYSDFKFQTDDNQDIFVANWAPDRVNDAKAVVQLAHGMAEHISRYTGFAKYLTDNDYIVYGNDHRGHGKTAGILENVGFLAPENGFRLAVNDLEQLTEIIKEEHPDLPVFLFGHSFGSLLCRNYIIQKGNDVQGVILSGTMGNPGMLGKVGMLVAGIEAAIRGRRAKSPMLDKMSFGQFNVKFKPNRTKFDWLSRDTEEVDKYVEDPYCGSIFSAGFFIDLLWGLNQTFKPENTEKVPKDLPIYLLSGEEDPVGDNGKGVKDVFNSYKNAGVKDVVLKLYPEGRHEMLNEINKEEVYSDIVAWLNSHL